MTPNVHIEVRSAIGQQLESVRASGENAATLLHMIEAPVAVRPQEAA